jgi:hypothetical protein
MLVASVAAAAIVSLFVSRGSRVKLCVVWWFVAAKSEEVCVLEKNQEKKLELSQWRESKIAGQQRWDVAARGKKKIAVAVEGKEKKFDGRFCFLEVWKYEGKYDSARSCRFLADKVRTCSRQRIGLVSSSANSDFTFLRQSHSTWRRKKGSHLAVAVLRKCWPDILGKASSRMYLS